MISYALNAQPAAADVCNTNIMGDVTPKSAVTSDTRRIELGTKIRVNGGYAIAGIRFYKAPGNPGPHVGKLYDAQGNLLRSVTFGNETDSGFQTAEFDSPFVPSTGATYVVASYAANGGYVYTDQGLSQQIGSSLSAGYAPASGSVGGNGVYRFGGGFPNRSKYARNFHVDALLRDIFPPSNPKNLRLVAQSDTGLSFKFDPSTSPDTQNYKVKRNGTVVATLPATASSFSDSGLKTATTYSYQVSAVDNCANGSDSNQVSATTGGSPTPTLVSDNQAPTVPSSLKAAAVSSSQVSLTFSGSTDDVGVAKYKVYRNSSPVGTTTTLSYNDTGLAADTTYGYQVSAVDTSGNESAQSPVAATKTAPASQAVGGAATWLAESTFDASSLETGRIGYLQAWGGDEFGYAYRYALSGQPAGVTVDSETGILSLSGRMAVGTYTFTAVVSNRKESSKVAQFPVTLNVRQGVTSGRTGDQILHKIYDVHNTAFGTPVGNDYTDVLMNIRQAIAADQQTAGDGNLRATIYFRRGNTYAYSNNRWPWSGQYLTVAPDPNYNPTGPRPKLQGIGRTEWNDIQGATLRMGRNWGYYYTASDEANYENPKKYAYLFYTNAVGDNVIRLKNSADGGNLKPGRYHMIISYDQQQGGFPPNSRYFEFVKVVSVSGDLVTLDRKLRFAHRDDNLEINDPNSLGRARIVVLDRGGIGGVQPSDSRLPLRATWKSIEFLPNPNAEAQREVVQMEGIIDAQLEDCVVPRLVPGGLRFGRLVNTHVQSGEGDKQVGSFIVDQGSVISDTWSESTSFDLMFLRGSRTTTLSIMPRQFRALDAVMDATGEKYVYLPLHIRGPWATQSIELQNTVIRRNDGISVAALDAGQPAPTVALGNGTYWSGDRLIIPAASAEAMVFAAFEGAIVFPGSKLGSSYGVVRKISAAANSSALYLDIQWLAGTRPTSGNLTMEYIHEISADASTRIEGSLFWPDMRAMKQTVPSALGQSWDFPSQYPTVDFAF